MRTIIFLLFLIIIPLAFASQTETTSLMTINDSATVFGKTVTILKAEISGKLRVSVDGVEGIVKTGINRTTNVNEMFIDIINFTYIDPETIDAILEITVNFECGDGYCNLSENEAICCTDCGCEGNLKCINNICQKEECVIDPDCEDDNPCTIDKCSIEPPRTCSNTLIVRCINNDTCCPDICGLENDTDCELKIEENITEPVEEESVNEENIGKELVKKGEIGIKKTEEVLSKVDDSLSKKGKGIFIVLGVAFLVIILGYFIVVKD